MVMPCLTKSGLGFLAFSQTGEGGGVYIHVFVSVYEMEITYKLVCT